MDELKPGSTATPLSLATLHSLPPTVEVPRYRREELTAGIVHIGVGNFHRAHLAAYLHDLMQRGLALDWAIIGAGVMPSDAAMRHRLAAQDWLTTLVEQDETGRRVLVTGVMLDFIPPEDRAALLSRLADPAIRIVSLTLTEGGYFFDAATGAFDTDHPSVRADAEHPDDPRTAFGLIVAALKRRRAAGVSPFTVMSCDNLPHNGGVTRAAVAGLARLSDPECADWIEAEVAFPNGMVDRITPAATDEQRLWLRAEAGVEDAAPVFCERFRQWVIEDRFPTGRPPFERAAATFTGNVEPFEAMKIRMLNGGHALISYPSGLLGVHFVHEAMAHPLVAAFLERVTREEIRPHVATPPGMDLATYQAEVARRFANPHVGDTIRRLCLDGSNRQPKFIVPSVADALANNTSFSGLALLSAMWRRYCLGRTEAGEAIPPNDPAWDRLQATAKGEPEAWLAMKDVYGATGRDPAFRVAFVEACGGLEAEGTEARLRAWLDGSPYG